MAYKVVGGKKRLKALGLSLSRYVGPSWKDLVPEPLWHSFVLEKK
jgi:hypothetical protein